MMTKSDQALLESLMQSAFDRPRDARSAEYKAGVRALLVSRLAALPVVCPHPAGSPQSDAFYSGKDEGCRLWREHTQPGAQQACEGTGDRIRGFATSATDVVRMVLAAADAARTPGRPTDQRCALFVAGLAGSLGCHRDTEEVVDALLMLAEISPQRRPALIG